MTSHPIHNPYTGELLRPIPYTTEAEARAAVNSAATAGKAAQAKLAAFDRAQILHDLAALLTTHREELVHLIIAEVGKTARDSRTEVNRAIQTIIASAEECRRLDGEILDADAYPPRRNKRAFVEWRPLGVVLAITPFNFPVNIPAHKIGPAFAAGNAILFKPSPQGHGASAKFVELAHRAGIPASVLQLIMPDVPVVQQLIAHPAIGCINFTGSVPVGLDIAHRAGMKRLLLELGGNDPVIILADADLDAAVEVVVEQRFGTAGQRCTAAKRVFVQPAIRESFLAKLVARTAKLQLGDPALETTDVGPVVETHAADRVMESIAEAVRQGARVLAGNRRDGNIIHPTILTDLPANSLLTTTEVFGPVVPVWTFTSLDDVITQVNAQPFGLQAGVFTNDLRVARELFDRLEVGALTVNGGPGFRAEHIPFGGVKHSGLGREGVKYAIREMSYRKTMIL